VSVPGRLVRATPAPAQAAAVAAAACACVCAGLAVGYLVSQGFWYLALAVLAAVPAFVALHRYPIVAVWGWLLVGPWVGNTDGAAARRIYWLVHRGLPLAAVAAVLVGSMLGLRARRLPRLGLPEILMAGYVVATLLSIGYSSPEPRAITYILYDTVVVPMLLYLLVRLVEPGPRDIRLLVSAAVVVLISQTVVGLISWNSPEALPGEWLGKAGERTVGSLRSADVFGTTLLFCGIFVLHAGLTATRHRVARVAAIVLFLMTLVMVFLTFSRATWLAALVATAGLVIVYRKYATQVALVVAPLVLLVAASGVLTHQLVLAEERLDSPRSEESALSRLPVALAAARMIDAKPVAGWGFQNFEFFDRPFQGQVGDLVGASKDHASHNFFLTLLAEQGVIGFALYLGPMGVWLGRTRANWRRLPHSGITGRHFVAALWLVVATFVVVNNFSRMQLPFGLGLWWLTIGLIATVVARYRPGRTPQGRPIASRPLSPGPAPDLVHQPAHRRGNGAVAYVTGTYPLLTTTFIDREIRVLRSHGVEVRVVALRRPAPGTPLSPDQRDLARGVVYATPIAWGRLAVAHVRVLLRRPYTYVRTLSYLVSRPHPDRRARLKTILHVGEGVAVAHLLRRADVRELHAHFADRAATVALVASRLLRRPYSLSIHAGADVFVRPVLLRDKIASARQVVTCTAHTRDHVATLVGGELARRITVLPHGLDLTRYRPERPAATTGPPLVVAVGQLVERKGFAQLIAACVVLRDRGHLFRCRIIGDGPDRPELSALVAECGLGGTVSFCGALPHDAVIHEYRRASMVVLPCIRTTEGDVDGLPNVIPEAMALERPVISSDLPAISELVTDGTDGILVPPGDITSLAEAMGRLLDDPDLGRKLAANGRRTVVERFDVEENVRRFAAALWPDLADPRRWA
jgi:colanic acid/amylovoran biosynthesis glycosyltransferase